MPATPAPPYRAPWLLLLVAVLPAISSPGAAEDLRRPHPVLRHDVDRRQPERYVRAASRVMAMSEEEMLRLVPTRSGVIFCGCPNCTGGQQENNQFVWTIDRPHELRCKYCGHVYPSTKYPMDRVATGKNELGEDVTYRYYFDDKTGRDYWFDACADYLRRQWFVSQCRLLAQCYHATGKPDYARRAGLILDRFAEGYPHMAVLGQWPYRRRSIARPTPPYPSAGGKWGRWMDDEIPNSLPEAFDLIYDSPELDRLARQQGVDVRQRIAGFFRATIQYTWTFGREPAGTHLNNMAPYYVGNMIRIGRVIGQPEYVHWGRRWVETMLREGFFVDGLWHESPSYHGQTIGGIRQVLEALKGHSDPPGYRPPDGSPRMDNFDPISLDQLVARATAAPALIAYPNGRPAPVHDTWARASRAPARDKTVSTLLAGFGHASLGRGQGSDQIQAQLHFSGGYGHHHFDALNLALFAKGSEILSDIGYTHTKLRHWSISTISHNTVAIDRHEQSARDCDGDLLLWVPDLAGLSAAEARAQKAYPGLAEQYRRLLVLVPVSAAECYVVDLFRVRGGRVHDWLLHGSADASMTADCSLALTGHRATLLEPSETWTEPIGESSPLEPYGLVRDCAEAQSDQSFTVTMRSDAAPRAAPCGVRVHVLGGPKSLIELGRSPRVRPAEGDDRRVYDFWMPHLVVRRQGPAPLSSLFAAVHEPFAGQPHLGAVTAIPLDPPSPNAVALQVRHGELIDTIISTLDGPSAPQRRTADCVVLEGRLAIVRRQAGRVVAAWLVDGRRLAVGSLVLEAPSYAGTIEASSRKAAGAADDAFITPAPLPTDGTLAGHWMIVEHPNGRTHAYEVQRIDRCGPKTTIVLAADHGLQITANQTEELFFPRRTMTGLNRFSFPVSAAWPADASRSP